MNNSIIDKILTEWAYRVPNGMPNPKDNYHLIMLSEAMSSLKLPRKFKTGLLRRIRGLQEGGACGPGQNPERDGCVAADGSTGSGKSKEKSEPNKVSGDKKEPPTEKKTQSNGYSGDKDKSLKQGDPNQTEEYNRDLEPDDDVFNEKNQKDANPTPPPSISLDGIIKNPKFPKRYLKVLERMANSKVSTRTAKWSHFSDIEGGAGKIGAQAGELMTMMGTSMSDEEFAKVSNALLEHEKSLIENHPEVFKKKNKQGKWIDNPGSRIIDKSWVKAAIQSRKAIKDRLVNQYGEGTEIVATAWDVENEVEAMGLSNYKENKGFSTDMYVKVKKPNGEEVLDEVSLKKSTKVNFLNSSAGKFEDWDPNLSDDINQTVYRNKARARNIDFINNKSDSVKKLLNSPGGEPIRKLMKTKGLTFEQALEGGSRDRQNVLWKTIGLLSKNGDEQAKALIEQDNKEHNEFVDKSVKAITENKNLKNGMLNEIRSEFPLKAVSDGEETMAIGPNSLDKKTMKAIFGTDNYDEIKENLVAEAPKPIFKNGEPVIDKKTGEQKMSAPFVGYNVATTGEVFPVAEIKVREDGRGYGGQFKFEMLLHKDFAPRLEKAQSKIYGEKV